MQNVCDACETHRDVRDVDALRLQRGEETRRVLWEHVLLQDIGLCFCYS